MAYFKVLLLTEAVENLPWPAGYPLHEQALARGAPAHWLGHIGVSDLTSTVRYLLDRGSQLLGPPLLRGEDGEAYAVLKDSGDAVFAVRERSGLAEQNPVVWHQLHTTDADRSWSLYSELFNWISTDSVSFTGTEGDHMNFCWSESGKDNGSIANTARLPGVHPHWLFYFSVLDLNETIGKVVALGGRALAPIAHPNGQLFVACEDPQGAAFGLVSQ